MENTDPVFVTSEIAASGVLAIFVVYLVFRFTEPMPPTRGRTCIRLGACVVMGSYHAHNVLTVPRKAVMAGKKHPHDGTCGRSHEYMHENPEQKKRQEMWDRLDHHAEFTTNLSTNSAFNKDFKVYGELLSLDEPTLSADAFLEVFLKRWFYKYTPVPKHLIDDYLTDRFPVEMRSVVQDLLIACSEKPGKDCRPLFRMYKHDNDGDGEVVGFGYPVGDGEDPNLYYMVTNIVLPIDIGNGNFRVILIDVAWTDRILKKDDEKSEALVRSVMHIFRYDVPWHNKAWWGNPKLMHDEVDWEYDEKEFEPKSPLHRNVQILKAFVRAALYQNIGIRYSETVAIRKPSGSEAPLFEMKHGLMRVIGPKHVVL